ncbi:hypothetical protein [Pseudomonas saponiphila]|uniref:hypothetical protein n=1 Tax=Pseudomonas saponiphila TaxID=556534 RepID=UPI0014289ACD
MITIGDMTRAMTTIRVITIGMIAAMVIDGVIAIAIMMTGTTDQLKAHKQISYELWCW